jgi:SAM-dependent methyltransferase
MEMIELLSISLLDDQRGLVREFKDISNRLVIPLGWHYLLDLTWAAQQLQMVQGMKIMDAGASMGIMQWWLVSKGIDVLSVDLNDRSSLDPRFRNWCTVKGLRTSDLQPLAKTLFRDLIPPRHLWSPHNWPRLIYRILSRVLSRQQSPPAGHGMVTIYNQDLSNMPDIPDASVDAVVSISALEHNKPDTLPAIVKELMRVIKPGGKLVATLGAAKERDWFHVPSKGWCYTEASLRAIFELMDDCPSNYSHYNYLFEALRNCEELRKGLAEFYYKSGNNGMPWGIWDPQYQSVGIVKIKNGK